MSNADKALAAILPKVITDIRPLMVRVFLAGLSMATVAEVFGVKVSVVEQLVRHYGKQAR